MMQYKSLGSSKAVVAALLFSTTTSAFYLPGVAPTTYQNGDRVALNVNPLTPASSAEDPQLQNVFSFDYYHPSFQFCIPPEGPKQISESLGSILFGDRIYTSQFELKMLENSTCESPCDAVKFDQRNSKFVNRRIWQNYDLNWLIDGLPAGQSYDDPMTKTQFKMRGFPLGSVDKEGRAVLNNHYDIRVDYHEAGENQYRVVGVLVIPDSRPDSSIKDGKANCGDPDNENNLILDEEGETAVTWTYQVSWIPSKTAWATRWDTYLHVFDPKIHWFSLINSSVIVVFLCGKASYPSRLSSAEFSRYGGRYSHACPQERYRPLQ